MIDRGGSQRSTAVARPLVGRLSSERGAGWLLWVAALCLASTGCWRGGEREVVVYSALDSEFARPILAEFEQATGIQPLPKFDIESTKTTGLVEALITEEQTRCDVFWNNEILHTLRLEKLGLLAPYECPAGLQFPAMYRSPKGLWYGFAARARILLVNIDQVPLEHRPKSIHDLVDPRWRDHVGLAKPLFGTTATHAACLFAVWGDERAEQFFDALKANAKIMGGNKQVAEAVSSGRLAFGLTDTDDAMVEIEKGMSVEIIYPDQGPDGLGTLFIPNTLSILRGAPHPEAARQLVDYLLAPQVEAELAAGPSAQIPLNPAVKVEARVETPDTVRPMEVDFEAAGDKWPAVVKYLTATFTGE